jgi:hypothetical protein
VLNLTMYLLAIKSYNSMTSRTLLELARGCSAIKGIYITKGVRNPLSTGTLVTCSSGCAHVPLISNSIAK